MTDLLEPGTAADVASGGGTGPPGAGPAHLGRAEHRHDAVDGDRCPPDRGLAPAVRRDRRVVRRRGGGPGGAGRARRRGLRLREHPARRRQHARLGGGAARLRLLGVRPAQDAAGRRHRPGHARPHRRPGAQPPAAPAGGVLRRRPQLRRAAGGAGPRRHRGRRRRLQRGRRLRDRLGAAEFIDIEDVPGAFAVPLDRVRLDALPPDGAWLRPTKGPARVRRAATPPAAAADRSGRRAGVRPHPGRGGRPAPQGRGPRRCRWTGVPTTVVRRLVGALLAGDQPAGDDGRAVDQDRGGTRRRGGGAVAAPGPRLRHRHRPRGRHGLPRLGAAGPLPGARPGRAVPPRAAPRRDADAGLPLPAVALAAGPPAPRGC